MPLRLRHGAAAAILAAAVATSVVAARGLPTTTLATLANPAVRESSGLTAGNRVSGILWTHNDSGDAPLLYATDLTGADLGTFRVTGADSFDWEDLAAGWLPDGTPALYVADTGDNDRKRPYGVIYRLAEPTVNPGASTGGVLDTTPAEALVFTYPDGPQDVEALLVSPVTGEIVLVAKNPDGPSPVYRLPIEAFGGPQVVAERVGEMQLPGLVDPLNQPTGGAVAPDGSAVVVRTLLEAQVWEVPSDGGIVAALAGRPRSVPLPFPAHGEAVAFDPAGDALLSTEEALPCPLYRTSLSD